MINMYTGLPKPKRRNGNPKRELNKFPALLIMDLGNMYKTANPMSIDVNQDIFKFLGFKIINLKQ